MQWMINYSPASQIALQQHGLEFDAFKLPPWPELIDEAQALLPVRIHWDYRIGLQQRPSPEQLQLDCALARNTATDHINVHFAPSRDGDAAQIRQQLLADQHYYCEHSDLPVAIENVPWEDNELFPFGRAATDAVLQAEIHQQSDSPLILDLAHARFVAEALQVEAWDWLQDLPLERLVELHVTGLGYDQQGRRRDSMPMATGDWQLLARALDSIAVGRWPKPKLIALEYGGVGPRFEWRTDADLLLSDAKQLQAMLQSRGLR